MKINDQMMPVCVYIYIYTYKFHTYPAAPGGPGGPGGRRICRRSPPFRAREPRARFPDDTRWQRQIEPFFSKNRFGFLGATK